MSVLVRGHSSDPANPVLELFTPWRGRLSDAAAITYQIYDLSDDAKRAQPVQVFPDAPGVRAPVLAGDRLGTGHVVARWTVPRDQPVGLHEVRWSVEQTPDAPARSRALAFDVVSEGAPSLRGGYTLVSELRAEGVTEADADDRRLVQRIRLASAYVDRATDRFFEPRAMSLVLDGSGGRAQLVGHPIIAIHDARMSLAMPAEVGELPVDPSFFRVYSRHLTQGLLDPDDRENPRLEFFHESDLFGVSSSPAASLGLGSLIWSCGPQNVLIDGVFGYTDPDGSPTGRTPELIEHVTKLLVLRELPAMTALASREERQKRWRLVSERTRDQGYNLEPLRAQGPLTGDPEVDGILVAYQRQPQLGSA